MGKTMTRAGGFTLIELMVVAAITGMLVGILVPVLSVARDAVRAADCKCNLRSLAFATISYTRKSEGFYPPAWVILPEGSQAWCGMYRKEGAVTTMDVTKGPLWPYLGEKQFLRCASFKPSKVKYATSGEISGYGINHQYVAGDPAYSANDGQSGMSGWARPARDSEIRQPSRTVLYADCARFKSGVLNEEFFVYARLRGDGAANPASVHFRHAGKANVAFCDGHVQALGPAKLDPAGNKTTGWVEDELMDRE